MVLLVKIILVSVWVSKMDYFCFFCLNDTIYWILFFVVFNDSLYINIKKQSNLLNWTSWKLYKPIYPMINNGKLNTEMRWALTPLRLVMHKYSGKQNIVTDGGGEASQINLILILILSDE